MNTVKISKNLSAIALLYAIAAGYAQQPSVISPSTVQQNGEHAIAVLLSHYGLDTSVVVPQTHKPLATDGKWETSANTPANCPKTNDPCVHITYRATGANVVCEWTVLLRQTVDKSLIIDLNEDAARYFSYKTLRDPFDHPVVRQTYSKAPVYPSSAKSLGLQGMVKMLAHIDTNGHVDDLIYIGGPVQLRAAAMDAVKEWKFTPLIIEGAPVSVRILEQVTFRMYD